ncbi:MAG: hypothetical protein M1826_006983 [Phylliscum demangeonii]|nr:MAG: hypothetical protein M1826_006983 [Phylliscum demangeonii]
MDETSPLHLYKGTRVNFDDRDPALTITVHLSGDGRSGLNVRFPSRKAKIDVAEDETSFKAAHLASSASVFCRPYGKAPQTLLARVLENGKLWSIRSLDFTRRLEDHHEPERTLQFQFPTAIRPGGIAFAENEQRGTFDLFVLTTTNELYTLALQPDFFHVSGPNESRIAAACKSYRPSSFHFRFPHRLYARAGDELLVCLHDGGLLRLTRPPGEDGAAWTERFFSEGKWGSSLRNLIPWQGNHTIPYQGMSMEQDTVTSVAFTSQLDDANFQYLFGITLNHRMKAWNLATGKLECNQDLLNQEREPSEQLHFQIDPAQADLIAVVNKKLRGSIDGCYVVTFSPVDAGEFKFWAITETESSGIVVQDLYPDHIFAPTPSSERWLMSQFRVVADEQPRQIEVWILWKNNMSYRMETSKLHLDNISKDWFTPSSFSECESLREQPLPTVTSSLPTDPTDGWLEYLFYPGQFTHATLETTLSIYNRHLNITTDAASKSTQSLRERVCSSVASSVTLRCNDEDELDVEGFQVETDSEWRRFYRILAEIETQRGEAICFEYDVASGMPWVVNADGVTALRRCADAELVWHHATGLSSGQPEVVRWVMEHSVDGFRNELLVKVAGLIRAATVFQDFFSEEDLQRCALTLAHELLQDSSLTVSARMRSFFDRCSFLSQITDEEYEQLTKELDQIGGLEQLDTALFVAAIELLSSRQSHPTCDRVLTRFGEKIMVKGARELIYLHTTILFGLLILLVFLDSDTEDQEELIEALEMPSIYLDLLQLYRENVVLGWFAKTPRLEAPPGQHRDPDAMMVSRHDEQESSPFATTAPARRVSTVLQYPWIRIWKPLWFRPGQAMSLSLTIFITQALAGIQLSDPAKYNQQVMWLQRTFLRWGDLDLAAEFLRYQPRTAWSMYIKARYHLCVGEYAMASLAFRKAAFNLAHREGIMELNVNETDDLLMESDAHSFNSGLPRYYLHVVSLLEREKAYSFSLEFASLGLQSHGLSKVDLDPATEQLRSELLRRLFNAALKTAIYDQAYSALMRYSDSAVQRADLTKLISGLCEDGEGSLLTTLPFIGLHPAVEETLVAKCHTVLNLASGPPWHSILYAWRMKHGDVRGAAAALYARLERLRSDGDDEEPSAETTTTMMTTTTKMKTTITPLQQSYLALINTLALADPRQAWLLASTPATGRPRRGSGPGSTDGARGATNGRKKAGAGHPEPMRTIITIADVRQQYQDELDRIGRIASGRYAFVAHTDPPVRPPAPTPGPAPAPESMDVDMNHGL